MKEPAPPSHLYSLFSFIFFLKKKKKPWPWLLAAVDQLQQQLRSIESLSPVSLYPSSFFLSPLLPSRSLSLFSGRTEYDQQRELVVARSGSWSSGRIHALAGRPRCIGDQRHRPTRQQLHAAISPPPPRDPRTDLQPQDTNIKGSRQQ